MKQVGGEGGTKNGGTPAGGVIMGLFNRLFGKKKELGESRQSTGGSPVRRELQRQRENTERCLAILARCRTRDAVIKGFSQISKLLRQANDPLADAAQMAATGCRELPDEYVFRLRDDFIGQCNAFLSATERGMREL